MFALDARLVFPAVDYSSFFNWHCQTVYPPGPQYIVVFCCCLISTKTCGALVTLVCFPNLTLRADFTMNLGGIDYTACPFNGWFMGTEVKATKESMLLGGGGVGCSHNYTCLLKLYQVASHI